MENLEQLREKLSASVDELGLLEKQLAPHKTAIARVEKLRKLIRNAADPLDVKQEYKVEGTSYYVVLGARQMERTIVSYAKLIKLITARVFRQEAKMTIAAVDALLKPVEQVGIVELVQTGPRPLNVIEKKV